MRQASVIVRGPESLGAIRAEIWLFSQVEGPMEILVDVSWLQGWPLISYRNASRHNSIASSLCLETPTLEKTRLSVWDWFAQS
jgi:hypothetical protein